MAFKSIALSGNPGAGKSALAEALSKEYGWPIHSVGRIWREKYEQEHPKRDISFEEFWRKTGRVDNININERAQAVFEKGNVIGELRYPKNLGSSCLLVFVTADIHTRATRSANREEYKGMSLPEITKALELREQDELSRGHELFGGDYDYRDTKNYHLIINSEKLSIAQEVMAINALMRK